MAKKNKNESDTKTDELLTIGKKKESVFNNLTPTTTPKVLDKDPIPLGSGIERTIKVNSPTSTIVNGLEEKILVKEIEPVIEIVKPIEPETIVYEITFQKNSLEQIVYTKSLPIIESKYILNLCNVFGRSNLKENVLGKREIKISCMLPLESTEVTIDMRGGLLIKVVPEAEWMNREYTDTKKLFDEAVLKAYRETATTIPANTQTNLPVKKTQKPIPNQGEEQFPVGNIPLRRNIIDF